MKRIISCLLAILLLVSISSQMFAAAAAEDGPTFTVSSEQACPGQPVRITIRMDNNPGIASIKLKVRFDSDLILDSITYNEALGGMSQQPEKLTGPVTLNWFNGDADTTGDMVYAVLDFTVAQTASGGEHTISVSYDEDDVYNIAEDDVNFAVVNGGINVSCLIGDADGNGTVDAADVTFIQRSIAGIPTPFEKWELLRGDADRNGVLDQPDVTALQRYIVKLETPYRIVTIL